MIDFRVEVELSKGFFLEISNGDIFPAEVSSSLFTIGERTLSKELFVI
jgi:hypothetical protein